MGFKKVIPFYKQKALVRPNYKKAQTYIEYLLDAEFDRMCELADERMEVGYEEYGDSLFHKDEDDLYIDIQQEIADAIVYAARMIGLCEELKKKELDKQS